MRQQRRNANPRARPQSYKLVSSHVPDKRPTSTYEPNVSPVIVGEGRHVFKSAVLCLETSSAGWSDIRPQRFQRLPRNIPQQHNCFPLSLPPSLAVTGLILLTSRSARAPDVTCVHTRCSGGQQGFGRRIFSPLSLLGLFFLSLLCNLSKILTV